MLLSLLASYNSKTIIKGIHPMCKIPEAFFDLADCPRIAAMTTIMPDGQPQTTPVWCDYNGEYMRVNTMRGFRKEKNIRLNPKVTLLCFDPDEPLRYLEVRGSVVEMSEQGALEHLDTIAERYTGKSPYFGGCVPIELKEKENPVLCKIKPSHIVTLDARMKE
jgi:PPOX class probable F420-dependent enzyme